jgi:hypothetical protein
MDKPRLFRIELHPFVALFCLLVWYYLIRAETMVRWRLPDPFRDTSLWGIVVLGVVGAVLAVLVLSFLIRALTLALLNLFWPEFDGRMSEQARRNLPVVSAAFLAAPGQVELSRRVFDIALGSVREADTRYLIALFDHGLLQRFLPGLSQWVLGRWTLYLACMHCVAAILVAMGFCVAVTWYYLDAEISSKLWWFWLAPFLGFALCLLINGWAARQDALNMRELLLTGQCPADRGKGIHRTIWHVLKRAIGLFKKRH